MNFFKILILIIVFISFFQFNIVFAQSEFLDNSSGFAISYGKTFFRYINSDEFSLSYSIQGLFDVGLSYSKYPMSRNYFTGGSIKTSCSQITPAIAYHVKQDDSWYSICYAFGITFPKFHTDYKYDTIDGIGWSIRYIPYHQFRFKSNSQIFIYAFHIGLDVTKIEVNTADIEKISETNSSGNCGLMVSYGVSILDMIVGMSTSVNIPFVPESKITEAVVTLSLGIIQETKKK